MRSYLCAQGHHFRSPLPRCPASNCTAEVRPTAMDPSTDGTKPSFKHLPRLPDTPLSAPLPASSAAPGTRHAIRWWAIVDGERVRRTSAMKDSDHDWAATCGPCGWEADMIGAMGEVDKLVQEHKK
jgi:hypothetical protein